MDLLRPIALAVALGLAGTAEAHVSLQPRAAEAGSYQVLRFGVGHGCGDVAATTALTIEIPDGVLAARPQPKPGWTVEIVREGAAVRSIRWRGGPLPADQFDEFAILAHLPDGAGSLAFPARQSCGERETYWSQLPAPGQLAAPGQPRPQQPAPILDLQPKAPSVGHEHH